MDVSPSTSQALASITVFAADRLLRSYAVRAARARLLARVSGVTMLGLGVYLALARRDA